MQDLLIFAATVTIFFVFSYLSIKSLERLDPKFSRFYDFGAFLPKSGRWSVIFYLIILAIIISIVLYLGRGEISKFIPA